MLVQDRKIANTDVDVSSSQSITDHPTMTDDDNVDVDHNSVGISSDTQLTVHTNRDMTGLMPFGIPNTGNTCWLASSLQCITFVARGRFLN